MNPHRWIHLLACAGALLPAPRLHSQEITGGRESIDLTVEQTELALRLEEIESTAVALAIELETEDPPRARMLRAAVESSRQGSVAERMRSISGQLRDRQYRDAATGQSEVADRLAALLSALLTDPEEALAVEQAAALTKALERLDQIAAKQRALRMKTPQDRQGDAKGDSDQQQNLADQTDALAEQLPQDASRAPPSDPQQGGGQQPEPQQDDAGQKPGESLRRASAAMRSAAQKLAGNKAAGQQQAPQQQTSPQQSAQADQQQAEAELAAAREALEERARILREEELARMLTRMSERFEAMRSEQQSILNATLETETLDAESRERRLRATALAERERALQNAARAAGRLLREAEGAAAYYEATLQIGELIAQVEQQLAAAQTGEPVQRLQQQVIDLLAEAIECLGEAAEQASKRAQKPNKGGNRGPRGGEPSLVQQMAELKMIRALQRRLLADSERLLDRADPGEAASLAERQQRLVDALDRLTSEEP